MTKQLLLCYCTVVRILILEL